VAQLDLSVDPKAEFDRKLVDPQQAAGLIESGDLVWMPSAHQPPVLLAALAAREAELEDVKIRSVVIPNMGWFRKDARKAWDLQVQYALFPDNRQALADKLVDFHPFSMIREHKAGDTRPGEGQRIDDLLILTTRPNDHGWVCVGNSLWDAVSSAPRAKRVIVEISDAMPRTCGDSWLHVSQIDAFVEGDRPRLGMPDPAPADFSETDHRIAANVKSVVKDADTVQLGLGNHTGALPILGAFDDCNDLGFFAELTVPGCVGLARRGIITSRYAQVVPDHFVGCFIGNSPEDLDHIEMNPFYQLRSWEFINDPLNIAKHDDMLTLNGALMVDLSGQVGVYAVGPAVYTGLGGQLAFHMGAFLSKRGRACSVLPSTAKGGTISTIVPAFEAGQIVSIPRELADTVITEQGVARLLGKSVRERAEELIRVAHPDYQDWLRAEAQRLYYP
jgi:4-hydroxybutyrate CoA-transferase